MHRTSAPREHFVQSKYSLKGDEVVFPSNVVIANLGKKYIACEVKVSDRYQDLHAIVLVFSRRVSWEGKAAFLGALAYRTTFKSG
jgi:hypothetical protein